MKIWVYFSSFKGFRKLIKFNKTIIPFEVVGYENGYSQLGATRLVDYLQSHIQRTLMVLKAHFLSFVDNVNIKLQN